MKNLILIILILVAIPSVGQIEKPANTMVTAAQSEIILEHLKPFPNKTQVAIAMINNSQVSYYGIKKLDDTLITVENYNSVFEIGSITKVFTATLLANLVVANKIKLDDNINAYVKIPLHDDVEISFKNLANHTSGLPRLPANLDLTKVNPQNPYKQYKQKNLEQYLTSLVSLPQNAELKYEYSNLGAGLLGYILSVIEKVAFADLLQSKIFATYQMHNSGTNINAIKADLVAGLDDNGKVVPNWEFAVLAGAGGILSTVEDLAKFALAQFDKGNKDLALTRQKTFVITDKMSVALGWHIITSEAGNIWYWHNGGTGGYSSSMIINPSSKNGIVVLSNVSAFNANMQNIDKLCLALMQELAEN